jgi:uncharacterized YigZ family protein
MRDHFTTIAAPTRKEIKLRGSRFIAAAFPVTNRTEVEGTLAALRKEFFDATHLCYAYRLGPDRSDFRAVDAGEPSGSAGKPILAAIDRTGLTDILLTVTRYFGGTKLGVGGLARAYGEAASGVLTLTSLKECYRMTTLHASFDHAMVGAVMHVASIAGAVIGPAEYNQAVHLTLKIRDSRADELEAALVEGTRGAIRINRGE